jgi:selenoprotein W-related protein
MYSMARKRSISHGRTHARFGGGRRGCLTWHRIHGTNLRRGMACRHNIVDLPFGVAGDIFQPVMVHGPRIEIKYCTQCRWLLRAAWMAQELLTTFQDEIGELALVPGTGGVFEVRVGGEVIWSRAEQGRFPDIKELKQLVRDRIAPAKDLGHSERQPQ